MVETHEPYIPLMGLNSVVWKGKIGVFKRGEEAGCKKEEPITVGKREGRRITYSSRLALRKSILCSGVG